MAGDQGSALVAAPPSLHLFVLAQERKALSVTREISPSSIRSPRACPSICPFLSPEVSLWPSGFLCLPFLLSVTPQPAMCWRVPGGLPIPSASRAWATYSVCLSSIVRDLFFPNPKSLLPSPVTDSWVTCTLCPPGPVDCHSFWLSHSR